MADGGRALALLAALLLVPPTLARADAGEVAVETDASSAVFSLRGARIVSLDALERAGGAARRIPFARRGDAPLVRLVLAGTEGASEPLDQLPYRVERRDRESGVVLRFTSEPLDDGAVIEQIWTIPRRGHVLEFEARVSGTPADVGQEPPLLRLELLAGPALAPRPWAGVGAFSERSSAVVVDAEGAREWQPAQGAVALERGRWSGARGRFWALLATSDEPGTTETPGIPESSVRAAEPGVLRCSLYVGPIERSSLIAADPPLAGLLFADRSPPLRVLALGLLFLLDGLVRLVGHVGLAIMALALAVKLLLYPLSRIAERWQREVNETRSLLAPGIAAIRAGHRGEERSRLLLALHRERGVHPLFGLKSLLGLAIQIPVFLAAYHMLDENIALAGSSFLWIDDLSRPDRIASLPFSVPFLGESFNLLPLLMAVATVLSTRLHDDGSLAPGLLRRQRRGLYAMAAAFFVLFYTFPAGMVLYWTAGSVAALTRDAMGHALRACSRGGTKDHAYSS